jgi:hypothetical protein
MPRREMLVCEKLLVVARRGTSENASVYAGIDDVRRKVDGSYFRLAVITF